MSLDALACLKKIPTFSEIPEAVLSVLADSAIRQTFEENSLIMEEGDPPGPLFIILTGKVRVFLENESGKMVTLTIQKSGSYFGELSMLNNEPRSASIVALETTLCYLIPKQAFLDWLESYPRDAALGVMRGLVRRIHTLTESVFTLSLWDVQTRLSKVLHEMAVVEDDELVIREKISHEDLASQIGSTREMVRKIMDDLVVDRYLAITDDTVRILRPLPAGWISYID